MPKTTKKRNKSEQNRVKSASSLRPITLRKPIGSPDAVPMTDAQPVIKLVRSYQATGAVNGTFTITSAVVQFMLATATNAVTSVSYMFRIARVRLWSNIGGSGNEGYCEITPGATDNSQNNFNSPPKTWIDTTNSTTYTARLNIKFKKTDPTGAWHLSTAINIAEPLFQIVCSSNTTMLIDYEVIFGFTNFVTPITQTVSGATVGTWYARQPLTNMAPYGVTVI